MAGQGVWGPDGDSLLLDYGASPPPDSPLKPSRRVMRAQRAGMAAAGSGHPVPPSPAPNAPAADLGSVRGSPEGEPPLVSAILASPTPRKGKGSSALRAITEARDMAASAAAGGGGGGGGGGGAGTGAGVKKSLKAATEDEDDEDEDEEEEEGEETTLSPQGGGFLSRL